MSANLIYRHPNGAQLYQGGAQEILEALTTEPIAIIVLAAKEVQTKEIKTMIPNIDIKRILNVPLNDAFFPDIKKYVDILYAALQASNIIANYITNGHCVLTTCAKGWNRSGLLNGLTLRRLTNCSGQDAIKLIKSKRGFPALSNPAFVRMIAMA